MQKQYKARQEVGRFHSGDIVGGLSDAQIQDEEIKIGEDHAIQFKSKRFEIKY